MTWPQKPRGGFPVFWNLDYTLIWLTSYGHNSPALVCSPPIGENQILRHANAQMTYFILRRDLSSTAYEAWSKWFGKSFTCLIKVWNANCLLSPSLLQCADFTAHFIASCKSDSDTKLEFSIWSTAGDLSLIIVTSTRSMISSISLRLWFL